MRPTVSQYAEALADLTDQAPPATVAEIVKNFLGFLRRRGEQEKMDAIVKRLEKSAADKAGQVTVTVVTAHPVAKESQSVLVKQAAALFPHKKIILQYEIDPEMIGGARFRSDETLYDATLAAALQTLKHSLLKA